MIRDRLRRIVKWLLPDPAPAVTDLSGGPGPEEGPLPAWVGGYPSSSRPASDLAPPPPGPAPGGRRPS